MRNRRLFAWIASGSAAAAAIAIFAFVAARPAPVRADDIIRDLRDTLARGFRVTFNNVGSDGSTLNGGLTLVFDQSNPPANGNAATRAVGTLYGDMRVQVGPPSEMAGTDLSVRIAHSPTDKWVYLHAAAVPDNAADSDPIAARLLDAARAGILIDLSHVSDGGTLHSGAGGVQMITGGAAHVSDDPAVQQQIDAAMQSAIAEALAQGNGVHSTTVTSVTANGQPVDLSSLPPEVRAALANANLNDNAATSQRSFKIGFSIGSMGAASNANDNAAQTAISNLMLGLDSNSDGQGDLVSTLARGILSGNAGQAEFDELTTLLNQAASQSTVHETAPGFFELTASGFNADNASHWPADGVLRIGYRRDSGVQWAQLENIEGGTIRFERVGEDAIDPALLGRDRLIEAGVTRVIDANNPWTLLNLLSGSDNPQ